MKREFKDLIRLESYESLNSENKVSLFVRYIDIASGEESTTIINKNK